MFIPASYQGGSSTHLTILLPIARAISRAIPRKTSWTILLATGFILVTALYRPLFASDLAKEKRMREQVADYIVDGDAVFLNTGSHEFLSIYMPAAEQPAKGTIIIIHGRGFHPNWPKLVFPLRTGLTENDWNTLSIQMPVLDNESSFYDYLDILPEAHPRINAAVEFIKLKNQKNIILLAHSCGVYMAVDWLHANPNAGIRAFIGIGMGPTDYGQPMPEAFPLQDIKIPVLDIRGENDYPAVQRNAPRRWKNIQQAANPKSQQWVVEKADHYFNDREEALLDEITEWLDTL